MSSLHLVALTLQRSSLVNQAVYGTFSSKKEAELVVARGSVLELLRPDAQAGTPGWTHGATSTQADSNSWDHSDGTGAYQGSGPVYTASRWESTSTSDDDTDTTPLANHALTNNYNNSVYQSLIKKKY